MQATTSLTCDRCGCRSFLDRRALVSHQRSTYCVQTATKRRRMLQASCAQLRDCNEHTNPEQAPPTDQYDGSGYQNAESSVEYAHKTPSYDSTFALMHWMRHFKNGSGLSECDIKNLFSDVLFHKDFCLDKVTVRSLQDCANYDDNMHAEEDNWLEYVVAGKLGDPYPVHLFFKDPVIALSALFSAPANREGFDLGFNNYVQSDALYSTPSTGQWWKFMKGYFQETCPGCVVAPFILYSDQTTLSNNSRVSGYPLVLTLTNISCEMRAEKEGHILLGVLPIISPTDLPSHKRRLEIFHECLNKILQPLKKLSYSGTILSDLYGEERFVFPALFAYICDHPKSSKVTGTYDGNLCQLPCSTCLCKKNKLSKTRQELQYRTEPKMRELYHQMTDDNRTDNLEVSKENSIHPIQCALWGFNGGQTELGNPYRAIHVDIMHQSDLGIFKTLVQILRSMAISNGSHCTLRLLDERLLLIKRSYQYSSFRILGTHRGGYFRSNANFAAFEHRAVLQVIVLCMVGLYEDDVIIAVSRFIEWYELACRKKEYSEATLKEMDELMHLAVSTLKKTLRHEQKSEFNLVKIHAMLHSSPSIRRSGTPFEYLTNMFEHLHIELMKKSYRSSNRRDFIGHILKRNSLLQAYRRKSGELEPFEISTTERVTALDEAVATGVNILSGSYVNLQLSWLHPSYLELPSMLRLHPRAKLLMHTQPDVFRIPACMNYYKQWNNFEGGTILQMHTSIAVSAGQGLRFGDWPLYGRAMHDFYLGPYYSDVTLQLEDAAMPESTCYAQLRLLFQSTFKNLSTGLELQKGLAFVRLYKEIPSNRLGRMLKCQCLSWVEESGKSSRTRTKCLSSIDEPYAVVEICSILKVIHIIPNFLEEGQFYVNRYKF